MTKLEAIRILKDSKITYIAPNGKQLSTEALNIAIRALKNEQTDGDLISRKEVEKCCLDGWNKDYKDILEDIRKLPSSEKTAEWIKQKSGDELFPEEIVCSKCYHSNSHLDFDEHNNPIGKVFLESKYCPNCGAKMKGGN